MLIQQEEEEWQEVMAQHDSFQQAAEPVKQTAQVTGKPGNSPNADHGPGALNAAQAAFPSDAASRDSEGESMQVNAVMPAAKNQPKVITGSSKYMNMNEDL